jgi:ribose transport system substrate-binding protein
MTIGPFSRGLLFPAATIAVSVLVFAGCKKEGGEADAGARERRVHKAPEGTPLKLAFVTNNVSPFWKIASAGVQKYEKESGVQVDIKMPTNGTAEEQSQIIEDLISQGYHGVAVSVKAPKDAAPLLNKAAKKMNVITHDSDSADSNRLVYIGTNNFEAGKKLGEQIVKLLPGGGKMAVFVGTLSADNARERLRGIEEVVKGHNIEIAVKKEDNVNKEAARSNVEQVLTGYPDVKLMCGLWSYNGPAIANAIEASGKKGKVLAAVFDEEDDTLKAIENGTISCTVVQKPFDFGYLSSKMLHELATKGEAALPKDPLVPTDVRVIDASNVGAFKAETKAMQ